VSELDNNAHIFNNLQNIPNGHSRLTAGQGKSGQLFSTRWNRNGSNCPLAQS
jgi:hypothetical protein